MYTEEVNKIALSSNNDKRLQTFDRITTYPHGANAFKVCESEMVMVKDLFYENLLWNSVITTKKAKDCKYKYKWSILMDMQMKTKLDIIQSGHISQIIFTEY